MPDVLTDDEFFIFLRRVADNHFQHEAVDLCFRKRIGSFLFNGILRSQDQEWFFEREGLFADGNLSFLHGFQQGALHLGGCPVDLVGQHEVGEDRSPADGETLLLLIVDHRADQVGR